MTSPATNLQEKVFDALAAQLGGIDKLPPEEL
jgi:hypothetical protein